MWTQQCSLSLPLHNDCGCWLMAEGGKYECNRWDFKIQRQLFIKTDKTTGHLFTCWSVNVPQLFFVLWRCQVLALLFTCLTGTVVAGLHQQGLSLVDGGALHPFLSTPLPRHGPIWAGGERGVDKKAQQGQQKSPLIKCETGFFCCCCFNSEVKTPIKGHMYDLGRSRCFLFGMTMKKMRELKVWRVHVTKIYLWVSVLQSDSPAK